MEFVGRRSAVQFVDVQAARAKFIIGVRPGCGRFPIVAGMMNAHVTVFFIVMAVAAGFFAGCASAGKFLPEKPVQKIPYVIVYGREECSLCRELKRGLDRSGIVYAFKDMGDERVGDQVRLRLRRAGLAAEKFLIPVVDVNGNVAIQPSVCDVIKFYECSSSRATRPAGEVSAASCSGNISACKECAGSAAV